MILALNANAALDRVFFIDRFVPNSHMRTEKVVTSVGGKGLDTALVLQTLGAPVQALSFIAGKNGEALAELLQEREVTTELIWLPGETRVANVIVETELNRHSHITTGGYSVTPDDCEYFLQKAGELASGATWAVIAGTLPKGAPVEFYAEMIRLLHQRGVRVLIDGFGAPMTAALAASPDVVKMNQDEFQATFGVQVEGLPDLECTARAQMDQHGLHSMVITCGKAGILALTPAGSYHAGCAEVPELNAAGAGDAVSAALVYRFSLGEDWLQALRWAAATSAAVVMTEGTAECHMTDVLALYPQAWVKSLSN